MIASLLVSIGHVVPTYGVQLVGEFGFAFVNIGFFAWVIDRWKTITEVERCYYSTMAAFWMVTVSVWGHPFLPFQRAGGIRMSWLQAGSLTAAVSVAFNLCRQFLRKWFEGDMIKEIIPPTPERLDRIVVPQPDTIKEIMPPAQERLDGIVAPQPDRIKEIMPPPPQ